MTTRLANRDEPIPGYRLIERLGRGGFGEVWKCEAPGGLHKAMKFVFGDLESMDDDGKPAEQELKSLNRVKSIRHPYILTLERIEVIEGQLVIVMELADRNMWDRYRECRSQSLPGIPRDELLRYMDESAEALDLMNQEYRLQHLDIKPQNIFLVHNHIKIADFGLAKDLENMRATITGGVTPVYAAPETFEGQVSPYCDQYSLAILYQELLTSRRPFNGTNTRQLLVQHMSGQPDVSPLNEWEREAVSRALSKKPEDRFPSCADFVAAIRSGDTPVSGTSTAPTSEPQRSSRTQELIKRSKPKTPPGPSKPGLGADPAAPPPVRSRRSSVPALTTQSQIFDSRGLLPATSVSTPDRHPDAYMTRVAREVLAPPEQTGDGVLLPALIIGLGGTGLDVLQQFKASTVERFGSRVTLPHIHYLHVDTDGKSIEQAVDREGDGALKSEQLFHARLNRPSYYLRKDGLPPIDAWMNSQLLYRMPRDPRTNGIRAFGRLALCDNYRGIVSRIRQALEHFTHSELLDKAQAQTELTLRSNRPRVYLVAGLSGGTGGGMFLDLAYITRFELRAMGYRNPEVIGLFPMTPADREGKLAHKSVNCYASLMELEHFSAPGTCYEARFDEREPPLIDADRPFKRCMFVSLPSLKEDDQDDLRLSNLAASMIHQELLTPTGRLSDESRGEYETNSTMDLSGTWCQVAGMHRLNWPRRKLTRVGNYRLALHLLKKWTSKETERFRESLGGWVSDEWKRRKLDAQRLIDSLHEAAHAKLDKAPEEAFGEILFPINDPGKNPARFDAMSGVNLLDEIVELLGRPDTEKELHPGTVTTALSARSRELIEQAESKLTEMAMLFVEEAEYRIPAAEAVVELLTEKLKATLETLEAKVHKLDGDVRETLADLLTDLGVAANKKTGLTPEIVQLLNEYPPKRYQWIVLQNVAAICRSLLGSLPEQVRDLQFCRNRLNDFAKNLTEHSRQERSASAADEGQFILPPGCKSLKEACDYALRKIPSDEIKALEDRLQARIRRGYGSLAKACLQSGAELNAMKGVFEEEILDFLERQMPHFTALDIFAQRWAEDEMGVQRDIHNGFDEAAPGFTVPRSWANSELHILGLPPGENTEAFQTLVGEILPDEEFTPAETAGDIVFYREIQRLPITQLPQLSARIQTVYDEASKDAAHPPHTRTDVPWQPPRRE